MRPYSCLRLLQGGPDAATILAKTAAAFLKFLDEAALFYKRLVMQLQVRMGGGTSLVLRHSFLQELCCSRSAAVLRRTNGVTEGLPCAVVHGATWWARASCNDQLLLPITLSALS